MPTQSSSGGPASLKKLDAGLYIHFPFCEVRCGYCDFFTLADREAQIPEYLLALEAEIKLYAAHQSVRSLQFSTLYFGGGTPTILSPAQFEGLLHTVKSSFRFAENVEVTVEANPATLDEKKLCDYLRAGINRLSLGVQSFHDDELRFLERDHDARQAEEAFLAARTAGFDNLSMDLIFSLPGQSLSRWRQTLQRAVDLAPDHISTYNLTFEKGTPLTEALIQGKVRQLPEEAQRSLQLATFDFLPERGFPLYEISNYAKPGFESRHNQKYWDGSSYLGLGPSAHSYLSPRRFWNARSLNGYLDSLAKGELPEASGESISQKTLAFEKVYLGLRRSRGVDLVEFERATGRSLFDFYDRAMTKFFDRAFDVSDETQDLTTGKTSLAGELLIIEDSCLRLTRDGFVLCDAICAEFD